jgi:hypothetical protein
MNHSDAIPYYDNRNKLIGFITEGQAVALADVKLVRRKSTGELKRVIDTRERLHRGEFLGKDVTSRPVWERNDGKCYEEELSSGRVFALKGRGI